MQERIAAALVGRKVVAVRIGDPVVLRSRQPTSCSSDGRSDRSRTAASTSCSPLTAST